MTRAFTHLLLLAAAVIRRRVVDWRRERRIRALELNLERVELITRESRQRGALMRSAWEPLKREVRARSPEQVARMERARGLNRRRPHA